MHATDHIDGIRFFDDVLMMAVCSLGKTQSFARAVNTLHHFMEHGYVKPLRVELEPFDPWDFNTIFLGCRVICSAQGRHRKVHTYAISKNVEAALQGKDQSSDGRCRRTLTSWSSFSA